MFDFLPRKIDGISCGKPQKIDGIESRKLTKRPENWRNAQKIDETPRKLTELDAEKNAPNAGKNAPIKNAPIKNEQILNFFEFFCSFKFIIAAFFHVFIWPIFFFTLGNETTSAQILMGFFFSIISIPMLVCRFAPAPRRIDRYSWGFLSLSSQSPCWSAVLPRPPEESTQKKQLQLAFSGFCRFFGGGGGRREGKKTAIYSIEFVAVFPRVKKKIGLNY